MAKFRWFSCPALGAFLLATALTGCGNGEEAPRPLGQEGAHEHGVARIDLAVDGNRATVAFRAPAAEVYGFERVPVTDEERERRLAGLATVESRMGEALVFEPALECDVVIRDRNWDMGGVSAGQDAHGDHSDHDDHDGHDDHDDQPDAASHEAGDHLDVTANFDVLCQGHLPGTRLRLAIGDVLPGILDVDLQVVGGRTFGGRYRSSGADVEL